MDRFANLLKQLNLTFNKPSLLEQAFTHRSYLNEAGKNRESNERLEFLGDAILSFLVSLHLYHTYPKHPEGLLTNLRSSIVKTETLSETAQALNLGSYLFLSHGEEKSGGRTNPSLLADTFEALLAAVYLDKGLPEAERFLSVVLFPQIAEIIEKQLFSDYKSRLQEIVQEFSASAPTYRVVKTDGPDHAKHFWVIVVIDDKEKETGTGRSKQEAEQNAAYKTLEKMGKL